MRRFWTLMLCPLAAAMVGCTDFGMMPSWMPMQQRPAAIPGVVAPPEKIARLRQLAQEGRRADEAEQQRVAQTLAESIAREEDPMIRAEIIRTLGAYPTPDAERVLRAAVQDPDAEARVAACEAWGQRGDEAAVEVLGQALNGDTDTDVRLAAADALGSTKHPTAVAALAEALNDRDPALQYRAVLSLRRITGEDLGNDVARWRAYVRNQPIPPAKPVSFAQRVRELF